MASSKSFLLNNMVSIYQKLRKSSEKITKMAIAPKQSTIPLRNLMLVFTYM